MEKVSVIIPTHNRPELLKKAITSVLGQTYQNLELVIVDDGDISVESLISQFSDMRIRYIKHETPHRGGAAARNTGIRSASGRFIAFLDDDDEWLSEKIELQMKELSASNKETGFCFTSVINIFEDHEAETHVPSDRADYFELALARFKTFLNVTLLVRREVLDAVGLFDERFPSHQEADLVIRMAKGYKGVGIDKPLVRVNMTPRDHIGGSWQRRINGRQMILDKYQDYYSVRSSVLAYHYFQMGLWSRDAKNYNMAREYFRKSYMTKPSLRYLLHLWSMTKEGFLYKLLKG